MRCRATVKHLFGELDYIKPLFTSKHSQYVSFEAVGPDRLTVRASGVTKFLAGSCEAIVGQAGKVTVAGHPLHSIFALLKGGDEVMLELAGRNLVVQCNGFTARLPQYLTAVNEPLSFQAEAVFDKLVDKPLDSELITINGQQLLAALKRVEFAAGITSYVNSVLVEIAQGFLGLVATDGHRIAVTTEGQIPPVTTNANLLVDVLSDIKKLLVTAKGDVKLFSSPHGIHLMDDKRELFVRSSVLRFPNYKRIIPIPSAVAVECGTEELQAVCQRVVKADDDIARSATSLSFTGSRMTVSTVGANERLEVSLPGTGPSSRVTVHSKYLQEALAAITTDRLRLEFSKHIFAILPVEPQGFAQKIVVMPLSS